MSASQQLASELRDRLHLVGGSLDELAARAGIERAELDALLWGGHEVRLDAFDAVARTLGLQLCLAEPRKPAPGTTPTRVRTIVDLALSPAKTR